MPIKNYEPEDNAFSAGKIASRIGRSRNPYPKHSEKWELWQAGYDSSEFNKRQLNAFVSEIKRNPFRDDS